jgi:zinc transport system substrate-binding protein
MLALTWSASRAAGPAKLKVLATTLPVYSLAATVAGDTAEVRNLLPPGVEPHDYQLSSRQVRMLGEAQIVLISGLGLESWMEGFLQRDEVKRKVSAVSSGMEGEAIRGVTPLLGLVRTEELGTPNPHFWLDPTLAARGVTNILRAFAQADPENAATYATNAARLVGQLEELDADYRRGLGPVTNRPFVTTHDSFAYLARRYHLKLAGVLEIVPDVEPSLRYLDQLSAMIRREKAGVIFVEPRSPSKLAEQLCKDLGIASRELDSIETGPLTATAYLDAMRSNLRSLKEGLSGKP